MEPITGVINSNHLSWEWIDDEICPECEKFTEDFYNCPECGEVSYPEAAGTEDEDTSSRICNGCGISFEVNEDELFDMYCEHDFKLIGSWKKDKDGKYEPDKTGDYSAIVRESVVQFVWSKHIWHRLNKCSPCYPGQADLDSENGNLDGYAPPPYLLESENKLLLK